MDYILSNGYDLWLIAAQVVTLASLIVKLTPSKFDDKIVSKLLRLVSLARK